MIRKFDDRQYVLSAFIDIRLANLGADQAAADAVATRVVLPVGTLVLRANGWTAQAFDGTAAVTLKGTEPGSDTVTTYANAVDFKAAGAKTIGGFPKFFPNGTELLLTAVGDSDSAGIGFVNLEFIVADRGNEVYE